MENLNYRNVNENPCNMCMPMGGILAFKGIENCMVIIHGSQGCSTYMRRHISEHFNEPIDIASSSLNEKGTIYGGAENLKKGLDNIIKVYQPGIIGILTTCLAETIGEDVERIISEYLQGKEPTNLPIIPVPTPGYGGTHTEGYLLTVKNIVTKLVKKSKRHHKVNLIIPNLSTHDIREIKKILYYMDIDFTLLPDYSDTLDRPFTRPYQKMPPGGTTLEEIKKMSGAKATIEMGLTVDESISAGKYLKKEFGVPLYKLPIPIGMENTDKFMQVLQEISGHTVPENLKQERGRLLDCMIDSHKYNFQGRCALFGEPELVYALARTCLENGVFPAVIATGSKTDKLKTLLDNVMASSEREYVILNNADFAQIQKYCKEYNVNLALGSSEGRYLTEKAGIPLLRIGFPIHDRVGGQRLLSVGYLGTTVFLDRLTNILLENKHKTYRTFLYQKYYQTPQKEILRLEG